MFAENSLNYIDPNCTDRITNFKGVVLGLSGGIDSALVAAVATDAFGSNSVQAIMLPSPFTADESLNDAKKAASLLNINYSNLKINEAMKIIEEILIKDEETFYDTIIYTHYGPITYDRNFLEDSININFAMRWIAHDESVEYKTFLLLMKSHMQRTMLSWLVIQSTIAMLQMPWELIAY